MSRDLPEWIAKDDNEAVPRRVRIRIFILADGRCGCCSRRLRPGDAWICDHKIALINGGKNQESNLQVLCDWCDRKVKTPADVAEKSVAARKRAAHIGIKRRSPKPLPGTKASGIRKRMNGAVERW
jgi:hypothetical protein